jgi:hypothetical protein
MCPFHFLDSLSRGVNMAEIQEEIQGLWGI